MDAVKPLKRPSVLSGISTRGKRPKLMTPRRSPGRRCGSSRRMSSSAWASLRGGIERERSTMTTTSLPALRRRNSGRASASVSRLTMATRSHIGGPEMRAVRKRKSPSGNSNSRA